MTRPLARFVSRFTALGVAATVATIAGCASLFPSIEKDPDFGQYFTMRASGNAEQARLEQGRLFGADIELATKSDGYRGRSQAGIIDLRVEENRIVGNVGSGRTELYVEEAGPLLRVKGNYAGRLGELELKSDSLTGNVGSCQYELRKAPDSIWYSGRRACNGSVVGAQVALPTTLGERPPVERAVLLAVFLGR